jgi:hypothetical protein
MSPGGQFLMSLDKREPSARGGQFMRCCKPKWSLEIDDQRIQLPHRRQPTQASSGEVERTANKEFNFGS